MTLVLSISLKYAKGGAVVRTQVHTCTRGQLQTHSPDDPVPTIATRLIQRRRKANISGYSAEYLDHLWTLALLGY
jgi:hypothetical protein